VFSGIYRTIAYVNGLFCLYLALAMIAPMAVDLVDGNPDWSGFLASLFVIGAASLALILANRGDFAPFTLRLGFLLVASVWLSTSLVSCLPFLLGSRDMSFTDAMFEAVSGLTTTGATVLEGLDDMPRGLLFWRATTQWLGGIGVVAMGVMLLPALRIGGMQFFRMESERTDKPVARIRVFAGWLIGIYCALTLACMIAYALGGMTWFNAMSHAMTTISTAGFSTHDTSFAQYGDAVLVTAIVFMLIGAMPFTAMFIALAGGDMRRIFDIQIVVLFGIVAALMVPAFASAAATGSFSPPDALLHSLFNVVAIVTTTGYATTDYTQWGPLAAGIFLLAMFVGGCAGSTSGGFKVYRLVILFQSLRVSVRELVYPSGIFPVHYNGRRVSPEALQSVTTFFFAYVAILFLFTAMLSATGLDLVTAFTGTLATLSNVGPALGDTIGPAGHFGTLSDPAKWLLIVLMFLGRLEIMTILVLLSPIYWRHG